MTAGALTIADQSLVVFVDDTGHEALVPVIPFTGLAAARSWPAISTGSSATPGMKYGAR